MVSFDIEGIFENYIDFAKEFPDIANAPFTVHRSPFTPHRSLLLHANLFLSTA
jgi:hypothetical protein